jgi:hypothetical protein
MPPKRIKLTLDKTREAHLPDKTQRKLSFGNTESCESSTEKDVEGGRDKGETDVDQWNSMEVEEHGTSTYKVAYEKASPHKD